MPRDIVGLRLTTNPAWGETAATIDTPESFGLVRTTGWTDDYGVDQFPPLDVMQNAWFEFCRMFRDIAFHGVLEWHNLQMYFNPAMCLGSDGRPYLSVQDNIGQNPVNDAVRMYWRPLIDSSSPTLAFSTAAQLEAGVAADLINSPLRLLQALFKANPNARWQATVDRYGLGRIASAADLLARANNRLITAEQLFDNLPTAITVPHSTTAARGIIRTSTVTEARGGTQSTASVTAQGMEAWGAKGLNVWKATELYDHPSLVFGSNFNIYRSKQNSGPSPRTPQDPTTDTSETYWEPLVPHSTTAARGIIRTSTVTEARGGTQSTASVTAQGMEAWGAKGLNVWKATELYDHPSLVFDSNFM